MALSHESGEISLWDLDQLVKANIDRPFELIKGIHNSNCRSVEFGEVDFAKGTCFMSSASFDKTAKIWKIHLGLDQRMESVKLLQDVQIVQSLSKPSQ